MVWYSQLVLCQAALALCPVLYGMIFTAGIMSGCPSSLPLITSHLSSWSGNLWSEHYWSINSCDTAISQQISSAVFQKWHLFKEIINILNNNRSNLKKTSNSLVITVSADGLAPLGARTSAGTVMTQFFASNIYITGIIQALVLVYRIWTYSLMCL